MSKIFNSNYVLKRLRTKKVELEAMGLRHLALFGSVARGEVRPDSDIDLAAVYDEDKVKGLFDMGGIANAIAEALGTDNFDLAEENKMRPIVHERFMSEHVRIF